NGAAEPQTRRCEADQGDSGCVNRCFDLSVYALAQATKVPRSRVNDIVLGRRGITADTAFRLARYFGTTPDFWINLQARHDLEAADRKLRRRIEREVRPRAA
ncbi:MAG: antitoxin HigA, partial [Bradyrhizobium sp.]|nr:antitoxin HigA [Bradyrhizobium sp.]